MSYPIRNSYRETGGGSRGFGGEITGYQYVININFEAIMKSVAASG
jgi:hypothetical protein